MGAGSRPCGQGLKVLVRMAKSASSIVLLGPESNFAVTLPPECFSLNVTFLHVAVPPRVPVPCLAKWMVPEANGAREPPAMVTPPAPPTANAASDTVAEMVWVIRAGPSVLP